jgi:PAS domain-containing protein
MKVEERTRKQTEEERHEFRQRITESAKVKAEPELREKVFRDKENIYKFLLDNSKEIILIFNKRGKVLFANKAILNNFGHSVNRPFLTFIFS